MLLSEGVLAGNQKQITIVPREINVEIIPYLVESFSPSCCFGLLVFIGMTLVVEIAGACFELLKLHNLDVKRERANAILEYSFVLPSNG